MLEKLLGLATVGSTFASVSLLHRFLSKLATVIALVIVASFMVAALMLGLFYIVYLGMISYGLTPIAALITVAALAVALTVSLILVTLRQVRELRALPARTARQTFPGVAQLGSVVEAFIEGLVDQHQSCGKKSRN